MATKRDIPWKDSAAKDQLTNDILEGRVTLGMKPKAVLAMHPELYAPYAKNFSANYRSLQRSIQSLHARRDEDHAWVSHDRRLHPPSAVDLRGYPRWDGHPAQRLLKLDVAAGKHKELLPKQLRLTRPEYMEFPLKVTCAPTTCPARSLKFAMAFFDFANTGFCPAIRPRSRATSAIRFLSASESIPVFRTTLVIRGTSCLFLYPRLLMSSGTTCSE